VKCRGSDAVRIERTGRCVLKRALFFTGCSQLNTPMEFLRHCASLLDDGADACEVLALMRERYHTVRCMKVKTCIVRRLCKKSQAFVDAVEALCTSNPHMRDRILRATACTAPAFTTSTPTGGGTSVAIDQSTSTASRFDDVVDEDVETELHRLLRTLPPRLPENVRRLRITRAQEVECKAIGAQRVVEKNRSRIHVNGRQVLATARWVLSNTADVSRLSHLAFALMLVTGRRACEILNGTSVFECVDTYTLRFGGQGKRRAAAPETWMLIPSLAPSPVVVAALANLRQRQKNTRLSNVATSRRYQSLLARDLATDTLWSTCRRVHALRGMYACIALRLFVWDTSVSDAYVAMCILGHSGLTDSLTYTTFFLGDEFVSEPMLGHGSFTHRRIFNNDKVEARRDDRRQHVWSESVRDNDEGDDEEDIVIEHFDDDVVVPS